MTPGTEELPTEMGERPGAYAGLRIITNPMLTVGPLEDWSGVRSHGRAIRRRKRGFRQNIRFYSAPDPNLYRMGDTVVGHPEIVARLTARLPQSANPIPTPDSKDAGR